MKGSILLDRGDLDGAVTLFLEALRVNPTYHPALVRLGTVEFARGNFADAAKLIERAIVVDPQAEWVRVRAAAVYEELGDTAAAQDVLSTVSPRATVSQTMLMRLCISLHLGETQRVAAALYALPHDTLNATLLNKQGFDCPSDVIRDDALERHDYDRGLRALEVCLAAEWHSVLSNEDGDARASCALRYASLLMASGERDRATRLVRAILKGMENQKPPSEALALLGDTDGALQALEGAFAADKSGWWYLLERAPEFEALQAQPRFQSLVKQFQDVVAKQSALLAEMRRSGEVPYRPPQSGTTSRN